MKIKHVGIAILIIGILMVVFLYTSKEREDTYIRFIMQNNDGSCFLEDGTCLHADRSFISYVFGGTLSAIMILLGLYLTFFDKSQDILAQTQVKVTSALKEARRHDKEKDEFNAFLSGFNPDEQLVLKAIKDQDGINQSTLRFKTGLSKTSLSLLLKSLKERNIISKKPSGKTHQIFLRKKF